MIQPRHESVNALILRRNWRLESYEGLAVGSNYRADAKDWHLGNFWCEKNCSHSMKRKSAMIRTNWLESISFVKARAFWMFAPWPTNAVLNDKMLPMLIWLRVLRESYPDRKIRKRSLDKWLIHERELIKKGQRTVFKLKNKTLVPLEIICISSASIMELLLQEWRAENVSSSPVEREKTKLENLIKQCGRGVILRVQKTLKSGMEDFKLEAVDGETYSSEFSFEELIPLVEKGLLDGPRPSLGKTQRHPIARNVLRKAISGLVKTKRGAPRKKVPLRKASVNSDKGS